MIQSNTSAFIVCIQHHKVSGSWNSSFKFGLYKKIRYHTHKWTRKPKKRECIEYISIPFWTARLCCEYCYSSLLKLCLCLMKWLQSPLQLQSLKWLFLLPHSPLFCHHKTWVTITTKAFKHPKSLYLSFNRSLNLINFKTFCTTGR